MACRLTDKKPLREPIMTQFNDLNMCRRASMSQFLLSQLCYQLLMNAGNPFTFIFQGHFRFYRHWDGVILPHWQIPLHDAW